MSTSEFLQRAGRGPEAVGACNACGGSAFSVMGRRGDGLRVMRCDACGLGVVESIPTELSVFYGDSYCGPDTADPTVGYEDNASTSEHGVSWAAALLPLLKARGRLLDVGCANGSLLLKLPPHYDLYGIEVNRRMAERATRSGVTILGGDLIDPMLVKDYANSFDVITAIAVFERLSDLRHGFEVSLDLLKPDGVLLFEVPFISSQHENRVWFEGSLGHVYYPSGDSLTRLMKNIGAHLVGGEVYIQDFASTFIGIVFRDQAMAEPLQRLFDAVTSVSNAASEPEVGLAQLFLMLVHAANSTPHLLGELNLLSPAEINPQLIRRLAQLWSKDLRRLADAHRYREQIATTMGQTASEQAAPIRRQAVELAAAKTNAAEFAAVLAAAKADAERQAEQLLASGARANRLHGLFTELANREAAANGEVGRGGFRHGLRERTFHIVRALAHSQRDAFRALRKALRGRLEAAFLPIGPQSTDAGPLAPLPDLVFDACNGVPDHVSTDDNMTPWPADRPLVSVVIPSFNYGHFVADAVDSVLAQTLDNLEIIVVEGGSTDSESRRLTLALTRPRTRIVAQDEPHLVGANRNFGISQARGKYICCLDADDMLSPTYLEKAVFLMEADGYDVVSSGLQFFGNRHDRHSPMESPTLADVIEGNHMQTAAVFRRRLWREVGGYRDADRALTGHLHEDWLFWCSVAALGARMHNMSRDYLFLYRSHGPSLSNPVRAGHSIKSSRRLIRQALEDRIGPDAIARSRQAAARVHRNEPPQILVRAAGKPVVLLALPFLVIGGAERLLSRIVRYLRDQGWRVVVTTSIDPGEGHGDTSAWFEAATAEVFHLPRFLKEDRWVDFVRYLVASRGVDVLWIAGSAAVYDMLPDLRAEFQRLRVVDLLFNPVGHAANNRKYALLLDFIFVENGEVWSYLRRLGEKPDRMELIQSGVDLDVYSPGPRAEDVTATIGAQPGELIVGFSGRWSEEKNPLAFVELARRLRRLPIRFVMTGAGAMRREIEQAVAAANLRPDVFHLAGEVEDVVPWLRSYDVLVLPSKFDGRPVVVMESLAMGVAVVASRVGALPELVDEGVDGYLCSPDRIEEFVDRLARLEGDRTLLARMKSAARRKAQFKLDEREMLKRYEGRLRALITTGSVAERS